MLYNVIMSPSESDDFLQVGDAAEYLGISSQTLRRWDREGRLTAIRRPGSKYRFYRRADLEPFRLEYRRAAGPDNLDCCSRQHLPTLKPTACCANRNATPIKPCVSTLTAGTSPP